MRYHTYTLQLAAFISTHQHLKRVTFRHYGNVAKEQESFRQRETSLMPFAILPGTSQMRSDSMSNIKLHGATRKWSFYHPNDADVSSARRRPMGRLITSIFRLIIVRVAKFIMTKLNKTYLHDEKDNLSLIFNRDPDVGILTISNHQSIWDDPGMWCGVIPLKRLTLDSMRSILMAEEWYYALGKFSANILRGLNCVPVRRGDLRGLESPALKEVFLRLHDGKEWVHLMVEGRIRQSWRFKPSEPILGSFRKGAAKLIACTDPKKTIVLPIYHRGMDQIFPEVKPDGYEEKPGLPGKTKSLFPRWGKRVHIYVGDPIDFYDLVPSDGLQFDGVIDKDLLDNINKRLYKNMLRLENTASEVYER